MRCLASCFPVGRRGINVLDIRITAAKFDENAKLADADFALDPMYKPFDAPGLEIAEVKPGLWEVANAGQGNYRMQFIELADRLIAYGAPVSPTEMRAVIKKLREKVAAKPISHVVLSHIHNDHVGGVKAFAEAGATLVTAADAQDVVCKIAVVQERTVSVVDQPAPALKFALVNGTLELGDATRKVTVFDTRGNPHVERLLVLVDGGSRSVMAADAYSDTQPFNATFDWLAGHSRFKGPRGRPVTVLVVLVRSTRLDLSTVTSRHAASAGPSALIALAADHILRADPDSDGAALTRRAAPSRLRFGVAPPAPAAWRSAPARRGT